MSSFDYSSGGEKIVMKIVTKQQETINRRFKQWWILKQVFHYSLNLQGRGVILSICVISQLAIDNGEHLFQVEYNDSKNST